MSLNGLHVAQGYLNEVDGDVVLVVDLRWSQTLSAAGTTDSTVVAPAIGSGGAPALMVQAGADGWIATGPSPNANGSPRRYIRSGEDVVVPVNVGDRLAWLPA